MKTAREILHKHTADETAIDYLRDIIVECMEEYASQLIDNKKENQMKAEEILKELTPKYTSFPAFLENEHSVDVYDIVIKAMEEYGKQQYKQGWDDRVKEAMKRVRTRPIKRL